MPTPESEKATLKKPKSAEVKEEAKETEPKKA
jgi:hypothetical protein